MKSTTEKRKVKWNKKQREEHLRNIRRGYPALLFDARVTPTKITITKRPE